jgi:hypothetical protein
MFLAEKISSVKLHSAYATPCTQFENAMATPEQRIQDLERSDLFSPDFPKRRHLTHAQWTVLSDEERVVARESGTKAIRRAKSTWGTLRDLVTEIGDARQESAVPLLARLWSDCALVPVRQAAGFALRAIGTPAARAALEALIEDAEHLSVFLAVQAVFDADPGLAFDRFAAYFNPLRVCQPGGSVIPSHVLETFCPSSFQGETPRWTAPSAPAWFEEDARWIDLCVGLRRDRHLGRTARAVLKFADEGRVKTELAEARLREGPRLIRWHSAAPGDLLARYRRGEHEKVWSELRAHEAIAGDCRAEALAVAAETMTRVARSANLLAERLASRGWTALAGRLRWLPNVAKSATMHDIEQFTGAPLPPSLHAFWDKVGGIDFVWNYENDTPAPDLGPDLAMVEMDPLCVDSAEHVKYLLKEWEGCRSKVDPELDDPCSLDLAPDHLHKANVSGGSSYGIELPYLGADPIFVNEEHGLPFVDYLRLAFRWGGFPRLERHAHDIDVRKFVTEITRDMEPF